MNSVDWFARLNLFGSDVGVIFTLVLLHFLWQGCVFGLLAMAADVWLRRASSQRRYEINVALLLMSACLPITFWVVKTSRDEPRDSVANGPILRTVDISGSEARPEEPGVVATSNGPPSFGQRIAPIGPLNVDPSPPQPVRPPAMAAIRPLSERYAPGVIAAYLLGTLLMLARLAVALWGGRRLLRSAEPIGEPQLLAMVSRQAKAIGLRTEPMIAWCARISVPVVVGVVRPVILLPVMLATGLSSMQLEALLSHELAHIRRWDPLVNLLQRLIESLLFFHPAVWYVSRRVSGERENACDDLVIGAAGWQRVQYADALVRMAELCAGSSILPSKEGTLLAASGDNPSQLKRRVLRVLEINDGLKLRVSRGTVVVVLFLGTALMVTPALLQSSNRQPKAESPADSKAASVDAAVPGDRTRDASVDPLPLGAVVRYGTSRLRHTDLVEGVAFSPDGKVLASTGWDQFIRLWDVKTGRPIRTFVGTKNQATFAAVFSPDGTKLASVGQAGLVRLWDVAAGKELWGKNAHGDRTYGVAFAPNGTAFATAGDDGAVRLWDANSGEELLVLRFSERVTDQFAVAFSPSGNILACGTLKNIHLYYLNAGTELGTIRNAHGRDIVSIAFASDGKTLISAGQSDFLVKKNEKGERIGYATAEIRMWDVATRKLVREFVDQKPEPGSCAAALSRDGQTLVTMHRDKVRVWDVATGKSNRTISTSRNTGGMRTHGVALSPDATIVATKGPLHEVFLWDIATGKQRPDLSEGNAVRVESVACSPDGLVLGTGGRDGKIRIWSVADGLQRRVLTMGDDVAGIHSHLFLPGGKTVVAGGYDWIDRGKTGLVRAWDANSGKAIFQVRTPGRVSRVACSPDGTTLAVANTIGEPPFDVGGDVVFMILDTKTRAEQRRWNGRGGSVKRMAFSRDGTSLVSAHETGVFNRWEMTTGNLLKAFSTPHPPDSWHISTALSSDGQRGAANIFNDGAVVVTDLTSGNEIRRIPLENKMITFVLDFSPDGRILISSELNPRDSNALESSICLWDISSGRLLHRYVFQDNNVESLALSPDARRLFSGMYDGTTLAWDLPQTAKPR